MDESCRISESHVRYDVGMRLVFEDFSELPPADSRRSQELLQKACPEKQDAPFFNRHMLQANALGFTWLEGLQFVIQRRRELN